MDNPQGSSNAPVPNEAIYAILGELYFRSVHSINQLQKELTTTRAEVEKLLQK